jgi:hypothetical protein
MEPSWPRECEQQPNPREMQISPAGKLECHIIQIFMSTFHCAQLNLSIQLEAVNEPGNE